MSTKSVQMYACVLQKAGVLHLAEGAALVVNSPDVAAGVLHRLLETSPSEKLVVLYLNAASKITGSEVISMGGISGTGVTAREVFRGAILKNAAAIILGHNHPSGDPTPSPEDIEVTRVLRDAGALLGVPLMDHIVVTAQTHAWTSIFVRMGWV